MGIQLRFDQQFHAIRGGESKLGIGVTLSLGPEGVGGHRRRCWRTALEEKWLKGMARCRDHSDCRWLLAMASWGHKRWRRRAWAGYLAVWLCKYLVFPQAGLLVCCFSLVT